VNALIVVAVIALIACLAVRVRVSTLRNRSSLRRLTVLGESEKKRDYAGFAVGVLLAFIGLHAATTGKGGYRAAYSQGPHIQLAGGILLLAAVTTIVISLRKK
jgi:hypothetical protein